MSNKVALLVVAGGRGVRLGADRPKQYLDCAGRPLIVHTLEALAASFPFRATIVAIHADDRALYDQAIGLLTAFLPNLVSHKPAPIPVVDPEP